MRAYPDSHLIVRVNSTESRVVANLRKFVGDVNMCII